MKIDFWTSTEYGGFMAGLIRELQDRGFDARQRFQISEDSYRAARSTPARLWLRFRQYGIYPLQLCTRLLLQRLLRRQEKAGSPGSEFCVVSTNTFFAPLLASYFHPHVVHLVYDLFPEALIHSGKWREGSLKVKYVRWITRKTLQRAHLNVFLGERLHTYVESIHGDCGASVIIPVGADQTLFPSPPGERTQPERDSAEKGAGRQVVEPPGPNLQTSRHAQVHLPPPAILYCGNFGNMHDSQTLFDYWRSRSAQLQQASPPRSAQLQQASPPEASPSRNHAVHWHFHCSGPKRAALAELLAQLPPPVRETITLGGGLTQPDWINVMQSAEVALVTMTPGSETVVMPSKTYSAMMAGQAILAIAPEASDLVDLIRVADCGWSVAPGDVEGLNATLETITSDPAAVLEKRTRAYRYAHAHLGQDALAADWIRALRPIGTTETIHRPPRTP